MEVLSEKQDCCLLHLFITGKRQDRAGEGTGSHGGGCWREVESSQGQCEEPEAGGGGEGGEAESPVLSLGRGRCWSAPRAGGRARQAAKENRTSWNLPTPLRQPAFRCV